MGIGDLGVEKGGVGYLRKEPGRKDHMTEESVYSKGSLHSIRIPPEAFNLVRARGGEITKAEGSQGWGLIGVEQTE